MIAPGGDPAKRVADIPYAEADRGAPLAPYQWLARTARRRGIAGRRSGLDLLAEIHDLIDPSTDVTTAGGDVAGMELHIVAGIVAVSGKPDVFHGPSCCLAHAITKSGTLRFDAWVDGMEHMPGM